MTRLSEQERQILVRIDRAVQVPEPELRYQLARKDHHPLAEASELLDELVDLEARGLIRSTLHFALTGAGTAELASPDIDSEGPSS